MESESGRNRGSKAAIRGYETFSGDRPPSAAPGSSADCVFIFHTSLDTTIVGTSPHYGPKRWCCFSIIGFEGKFTFEPTIIANEEKVKTLRAVAAAL
ncbi:hypothetical protein J6590_040121 [Homalodisca vitripennis]|nr:hypothetical protein J6590_040121 [Homalodisca vitripennis]